MTPVDEDAVRAMSWRAIQEINGLSRARDYDLTATLMRCGLASGFGFDDLEAFRGARRIGCFGFFRDKTHYAGACRVEAGYSHVGGVMVQTSGGFEGVWVFMLDTDSAVLTSKDSGPVESFQGLDGPDLIEAVVSSALTEELAQPARQRRFRRN